MLDTWPDYEDREEPPRHWLARACRALAPFVLALALGVAGAMISKKLGAEEEQPIAVQCRDGYCVLKQEDLRRLVQWATLCRWPGLR